MSNANSCTHCDWYFDSVWTLLSLSLSLSTLAPIVIANYCHVWKQKHRWKIKSNGDDERAIRSFHFRFFLHICMHKWIVFLPRNWFSSRLIEIILIRSVARFFHGFKSASDCVLLNALDACIAQHTFCTVNLERIWIQSFVRRLLE